MKTDEKLPFARAFWDLVVYQKARALQGAVFSQSKGFSREETYSLTDQIRRASRSIGAQIAEAWAKRGYEKHFISKLTDAPAETYETQHWLITAVDDGRLTSEQGAELFKLAQEIGRMLHRMTESAHEFCQDSSSSLVRETTEDWFGLAPASFPAIS